MDAPALVAKANTWMMQAAQALDQCVDPVLLRKFERQVDGLHYMAKQLRVELRYANQITAQRFRLLRKIGQILADNLPHAGGRPATSPTEPPTIHRGDINPAGLRVGDLLIEGSFLAIEGDPNETKWVEERDADEHEAEAIYTAVDDSRSDCWIVSRCHDDSKPDAEYMLCWEEVDRHDSLAAAEATATRLVAETLPAKEGFPTLAELGFSYNFSVETQRIAAIREDWFEAYIALGQNADETVDRPDGEPQYRHPVDLTKSGLIAYANGMEAAEYQEKQRQEIAEKIVEQATAAAAKPATVTAAAKPVEYPPDEPAPSPAPERPAPKADRIKAALRTAIHPTTPAHEAAAAMNVVRNADPHLRSLDQDDDSAQAQQTYFDQIVETSNGWSNRALTMEMQRNEARRDLEKARARIAKLQASNREKLDVIATQKAEIERIDQLAKNLEVENNRLRALLDGAGITDLQAARENTVH